MNTILDALAARLPRELENEDEAVAALVEAEKASPLPDAATVESRLPEKGVSVGLTRLHARALAAEGRHEEAGSALFALAERLNQAGYHRALGRLLGDLLPVNPTQAAPLVARARVHGGRLAVDDPLLFEAQARHPGHGLLGWLAALAHQELGDLTAARRLATRALPELVAEKDYENAESALLLLAEGVRPEAFPSLGRTFEILARHEAWSFFHNAYGLLEESLVAPGGAVVIWPHVREIWRKHPDAEGLRERVVRLLRGYLAARYPRPEELLRLSEIERPSQPAEVVLDRLESGERFPPGYYARHAGWGLGLIRENDTQSVVLDFPQKPLHRMSMATAAQALTILGPGDFRVLLTVDPEGLRALAAEDPATIVVKVLEARREPRASTEEIRKALVPEVIPAAAWPRWWKGALEALAGDPRIDHRKAYANLWSLASPALEEVVHVPAWDAKKDAIKNLALLETFLAQHPGDEEPLLDEHRERVEALASGRDASPEEAAACGLWLLRVVPGHDALPEAHVGAGFDMNLLSRADQEMLLPRLSQAEALAAALDSRLVGVRRAARERLAALDPDGRHRRAVLAGAIRVPEAALEILESLAETPGGSGFDETWSRPLLLAALDLLEQPPREAHRKRALALVAPGSPLDAHLGRHPVPEDERRAVVTRLVKWQSSDRFRFPVLEFLGDNGHADIAESVEGARARAAARVSGRVGQESEDPFEGAVLLTRVTFDRLAAERHRVGIELKTVIPQAIQKAREHGDLRENAEYDAAKAKQSVYAKRFAELETLLTRVRLIEDLKREPGVAAPGTAVTLVAENGAERWSYWILGEGDQELGAEVVSYRAPLGKLLLGLRAGEWVELTRDSETVRCRVEAVTERLP